MIKLIPRFDNGGTSPDKVLAFKDKVTSITNNATRVFLSTRMVPLAEAALNNKLKPELVKDLLAFLGIKVDGLNQSKTKAAARAYLKSQKEESQSNSKLLPKTSTEEVNDIQLVKDVLARKRTDLASLQRAATITGLNANWKNKNSTVLWGAKSDAFALLWLNSLTLLNTPQTNPGTLAPTGFFTSMYQGSTGARPTRLNPKYSGSAIYLHYPDFKGSAANTVKVGDYDVGKHAAEAVGINVNNGLPVGHGAVILIGKNGLADYFEYGRYTGNTGNTKIIGHKRPTVRGGNWRHKVLPQKKAGESDLDYMARIYKSLPDASTGLTLAIFVPQIDTETAKQYILSEANNTNRSEYGALHTCATEASKIITDNMSPDVKMVDYGASALRRLGLSIPDGGLTDSHNTATKVWDTVNPLSSGNYALNIARIPHAKVVSYNIPE